MESQTLKQILDSVTEPLDKGDYVEFFFRFWSLAYNTGHLAGYKEGYQQGFEEGKQDERDSNKGLGGSQ